MTYDYCEQVQNKRPASDVTRDANQNEVHYMLTAVDKTQDTEDIKCQAGHRGMLAIGGKTRRNDHSGRQFHSFLEN